MKFQILREEELKNKVAQDYFSTFDCTRIIGNVDFAVSLRLSKKELFEQESLLWAEAKKGSSDIYNSIVQLILTIGRARTFEKYLPPAFLGAFDGEKIALVPYNDIHEVFYITDFNWNVTPSNQNTKEFKLIHEKVKSTIDAKTLLFNYTNDDNELRKFIENNFIVGKFVMTKTRIDKNNFVVIYNKWLLIVKQTISVNWGIAKKGGIIDGDFYLADLLSNENNTLKEKLFVLLKHDHYILDRRLDEAGMFNSKRTDFVDKQVAHTQFWNKYDRPPKEEYWDYIVERRDLLVPQDIRERKGSFFTPQIWVELSQKYLGLLLGDDWQDEYYIWDCAAGTGNLLNGLTNKYNIWASTLDTQDVEVMHDRIKNGANLLDDHVFQFDFLNGDFDTLPKTLQDIVKNPEKRKKLIIYINPPYAEASSYGEESKALVANTSKVFEKYKSIVGADALNELFAQFIVRIYSEIPNALLAIFSKPKYITSEKFLKFRKNFLAEFNAGFVCRADTFDNVKGQFPITFVIWKMIGIKPINNIKTDVYEIENNTSTLLQVGLKKFFTPPKKTIADWRASFYLHGMNPIGYMIIVGPSMQSNNNTFFTNKPAQSYVKKSMVAQIEAGNIIEMSIYLAVRHSIQTTWLNDKDVFSFPNDDWKLDKEFQNDCLAFALFDNSNCVSNTLGTNHWIPFSEQEVNSREKFESNFIKKFIDGKLKPEISGDLFQVTSQRTTPIYFSDEASNLFDAARDLWIYYHQQFECNVNASLYDIREHFQGRNDNGKMNNRSQDDIYMKLIGNVREKVILLGQKIEQMIYEYEFLKR